MNQIERLQGELAKRFPDLKMEIGPPKNEGGTWFLDVQREARDSPVVVEWKSDRGFGVSTPGIDDFGCGPDEIYTNVKAAFNRVESLVVAGGRTEPSKAVKLAELRQSRGFSQSELADRAGVRQANISRIEGRGDLKLSTLANVLAAMGATLSIRARFPDGDEREINLDVVRSGPAGGPPPGPRAAILAPDFYLGSK